MDIKKFMAEIENKELNYINIDRIEKQIKVKLPYDVRCILSNNFETVSFDNNIRLLSMDEINDLQKDLDVDFVSMGMIPLFDFFDNDFIVYNFKENYFAIYNIIDKILFKKKEKLMDFFLDNLS